MCHSVLDTESHLIGMGCWNLAFHEPEWEKSMVGEISQSMLRISYRNDKLFLFSLGYPERSCRVTLWTMRAIVYDWTRMARIFSNSFCHFERMWEIYGWVGFLNRPCVPHFEMTSKLVGKQLVERAIETFLDSVDVSVVEFKESSICHFEHSREILLGFWHEWHKLFRMCHGHSERSEESKPLLLHLQQWRKLHHLLKDSRHECRWIRQKRVRPFGFYF